MPLIKKLSRSGSSAALIIDKPIMQMLGWNIGDEVDLKADAVLNRLIIEKVRESVEEEDGREAQRT